MVAVFGYLLSFHNPRVGDRVLSAQVEIQVAFARVYAGKANLVDQVDRCFLWLHAERAKAMQRFEQPLVDRADDRIFVGNRC